MNFKHFYKKFLLLIFFLIASSNVAFARRMTPQNSINGSVRVNICGDSIAEGIEQCDRNDLRGLRCSDFDFSGGNLSCNLVCELDFSNCSKETQGEPSEDEKDVDTGNGPDDNSIREILERYIPEIAREREQETTDLPSAIRFLQYFDENSNGIIESSELPTLILNWVNGWKYSYSLEVVEDLTCDLNDDSVCDLADFSILMFNLGQ